MMEEGTRDQGGGETGTNEAQVVLWLDRGAAEGLSPTCGRAGHWGQLSALLAIVLHAWQPWPTQAALGDSALVSLWWAQALVSPCVKWAIQVTGLGRKAMLTAKRQEAPPQSPKGAQHKATRHHWTQAAAGDAAGGSDQ